MAPFMTAVSTRLTANEAAIVLLQYPALPEGGQIIDEKRRRVDGTLRLREFPKIARHSFQAVAFSRNENLMR